MGPTEVLLPCLVPEVLHGTASDLGVIPGAGLPPSYALTVPVAALIGAQGAFIAAGVLCAGVTIAALFLPHMREADGALTAGRLPILQGQAP